MILRFKSFIQDISNWIPVNKIHKKTYKQTKNNGYNIHTGISKKTGGHIVIIHKERQDD